MSVTGKSIVGAISLSTVLICYSLYGEPSTPLGVALDEPPLGLQVAKSLAIRVLDPAEQPVHGATVTPWALRSSQGHGWWSSKDDPSEMRPTEVITNEAGEATIAYPHFRNADEGTRTIGVSVFVDHRDYAYPDAFHIDVPREDNSPYEVKLEGGVSVELQPTIADEPASTDNLFAYWSGGRSWKSGHLMERTAHSTLRLPPLKPGKHSALVAKLDGDRVTHISGIVEFETAIDANAAIEVPLEPADWIEGAISDNVPRPVLNGRMKVRTLPPTGVSYERVQWFTWVPIQTDGTFAIEAWPTGEKLQLIALCDGFVAKSGLAPPEVENPRDPATDPFTRPQVFDPSVEGKITVEMEKRVECAVTVVDEDDQPVAGVKVVSWPNVGWWNGGSQVYCARLVRGERLLRVRDYQKCIDQNMPEPFQAITDREGRATLFLPQGKEGLTVQSDIYELPINIGRRDVKVEMVAGETTEVTLRLQPKGTEKLGEWDKLAGVVFGCSTREGRRLCALPEVREKIDEFTERFRKAKNQKDPKLLAEAYIIVADAFANIGDHEEALKWSDKAAEQEAKGQLRDE